MAKHRKQKARTQSSVQHLYLVKKHLLQGIFGLFSCLSALLLLALLTYASPHSDGIWYNAAGRIGAYTAKSLFSCFGFVAYVIPFGLVAVALHLIIDHKRMLELHWALLVVRMTGLSLFLAGSCGLSDVLLYQSQGLFRPGGSFGLLLLDFFWQGFKGPGTVIVLLSFLMLGMTWLLGISWLNSFELFGQALFFIGRQIQAMWHGCMAWKFNFENKLPRFKAPLQLDLAAVTQKTKPVKTKALSTQPVEASELESPPLVHTVKQAVTIEGLPELSLLEKSPKQKASSSYSASDLEHLSRQLEQHLMDFAVQAQVVAVHPGPVITRFELQLGAGTKVSKLSSLAKDLARSLSVRSVRVVEVIPGKTVVGLELPNPERLTVRFGDVLSSDVYTKAHSPLSLALGVDIAGHPMIVDLAKMPHLLVAGTTGSGKSVGINAMILSLLFKSTPEQVRLILIDPKMLELSVYDGIPHLLTPVVTDMREAASSLRWCVSEMERRYRLMSGFGVRNIAGFNEKLREAIEKGEPLTDPTIDPLIAETPCILEPLPYIVIVIDELADMMMVVGKKVEQLIARIAQKARAAGIHLILATQRPSVDVLTGLIKSNIPTRISFQVSSKIDSRTILDQQGAEQLLGHGDMLFLAPGTGAPLRVHGAYVDDNEVHRVAKDWCTRGRPNYIEAITQMSVDFGEGNNEGSEAAEDSDPLYDQVVEFVIENRKASISSVQRRFKIGYNRSARLVEEMERVGILGPMEGGVREVLVAKESS